MGTGAVNDAHSGLTGDRQAAPCNVPSWDRSILPKPTTDPVTLRRNLDVFGYGIIENALDDELLSAVQQRLFEQAEAERAIYSHRNPANPVTEAQWVNMLLNKGDVFFDLIRHPLAMSMIEYVLGPEYLVSCVDSQIQHPGAGIMPLHTDQWWMPPLSRADATYKRASTMRRDCGGACDFAPADDPISPPVMANVMWMITDFSETTGATRVVPGSHLSGRAPDASVPHRVPSIAAEGPAGTAIVFDGRLWHSAWSNTSADPRFGITTACCGPQCRPIENYTRGMRPEVLENCSPEILDRLGFAAWSSYGHTGDLDARPSMPGELAMGPLYTDD